MELAVNKSSPLGQYLAGLEDEDGGSMAQMLTETCPRKEKRPERKTASDGDWAVRVDRRLQMLLLHRVIPWLRLVRPTFREELQQVGGLDGKLFTKGEHWGRQFAALMLLDVIELKVESLWRNIVLSAVSMGAVAIVAMKGSLLRMVAWSAALIVLALLALELSVRMLLYCHDVRAKRLVDKFRSFDQALDKFKKAFNSSLTLVKRAELASRGYRLGAGMLPPIGRLEDSAMTSTDASGEDSGDGSAAVKHHLRCLPLRRRLRAVNDQLESLTSRFVTNGEVMRLSDEVDNKAENSQAPSLLLTALTKQHSRASLQLEYAVYSVLVRSLARTSSPRKDNVFRVLGLHHTAVGEFICRLSCWSGVLESWNAASDPAAMSPPKSVRQSFQDKQQLPNVKGGPHRSSIAIQLQELRSTSETLSALVIAAQYEVASGTDSLSTSTEAMGELVHQLQKVWGDYEAATHAVRSNDPKAFASAHTNGEKEHYDAVPTIIPPDAPTVPDLEDSDCTVIFTGTSTGDEGFDLQALLKQQEADTTASSAAAKPLFVRELRDVLAYRQANSYTGRTKQVDQDPAQPKATRDSDSDSPLPPAPNASFALPRAPPRGPRRRPMLHPRHDTSSAVSAFSMELQSLLQKSLPLQQSDVLES